VTAKTRKEQILEMLAAEPGDPFLRYGLAMEHISAGDDAAAIDCFKELLADNPDYVPAYLQLAQACVRLGRLDEAREDFRRGIDVARKNNDLHAAEEMQNFLASLG
jgi:Tfp pilus assembly protein PilF